MVIIIQFEWNDGYARLYYKLMLPDEVQEKLNFASRLIYTDVNEALCAFNDYLKQGAECINEIIYIHRFK